MKAIQAGIMPSFDNIADNDFGDLVSDFAIEASGFIEIPSDGKYKFRVWSDDGSKVTLSGKVILDHDGPHGTSHKETELFMKKAPSFSLRILSRRRRKIPVPKLEARRIRKMGCYPS